MAENRADDGGGFGLGEFEINALMRLQAHETTDNTPII